GLGDGDAERHAAGNAFGTADDVRLNISVLNGPHFAGASAARLHFIGHEQNAVLVTDTAQLTQEYGGSGNISTFALHGFNEDRRTLFRRNSGLEDFLLEETCT